MICKCSHLILWWNVLDRGGSGTTPQCIGGGGGCICTQAKMISGQGWLTALNPPSSFSLCPVSPRVKLFPPSGHQSQGEHWSVQQVAPCDLHLHPNFPKKQIYGTVVQHVFHPFISRWAGGNILKCASCYSRDGGVQGPKKKKKKSIAAFAVFEADL